MLQNEPTRRLPVAVGVTRVGAVSADRVPGAVALSWGPDEAIRATGRRSAPSAPQSACLWGPEGRLLTHRSAS